MFLGSGSVIHACHHEQDMRKMGGLHAKIPVTSWTFLVGVLAIAGLPFLSGFYSKDAILAGAYHRFPVLFWFGLTSAVVTAFYMTRLYVMTFLGEPRDHHIHEHAHEGGRSMTLPLLVLALLAVITGWPFLPWHETLLAPPTGGVIESARTVGDIHHFEHSNPVMFMAIAAGLIGLAAGYFVFRKLAPEVLLRLKRPLRALERAFANKFWFDELYRVAVLKPAYGVARMFAWADAHGVDGLVNAAGRGGVTGSRLSGVTDRVVVDGAVNGTGTVLRGVGGVFTWMQGGRVRAYLSWSVAAVAAFFLVRQVL